MAMGYMVHGTWYGPMEFGIPEFHTEPEGYGCGLGHVMIWAGYAFGLVAVPNLKNPISYWIYYSAYVHCYVS